MCLQLVTKDIGVLLFSQLVKWPRSWAKCVQENASGHLGLIGTYLWWDLFGSHIFGSRVRARVKISWSDSVTDVSMKNAFLEKNVFNTGDSPELMRWLRRQHYLYGSGLLQCESSHGLCCITVTINCIKLYWIFRASGSLTADSGSDPH